MHCPIDAHTSVAHIQTSAFIVDRPGSGSAIITRSTAGMFISTCWGTRATLRLHSTRDHVIKLDGACVAVSGHG
jgi:hypothetical protein